MQSDLLLLPTPQQVFYLDGQFSLNESCLVLLEGGSLHGLRFSAGRFQKLLKEKLGLNWEVTASQTTPIELIGLTLRVSPSSAAPSQGYELWITSKGLSIEARDEAGIFNGISTLLQIIDQSGLDLPTLHVIDWPDFPVRGVMLDVSRDKVPTTETLHNLIDLLASWKINQLQFYMEHTFAYRRHPVVWAEASPLTAEEMIDLDAYCKQRYIELVPNQNSFGHFNRWLKHKDYADLAEVAAGFDAPWGRVEEAFSLCPADPRSLNLIFDLYDELLPNFTSKMVNVGCDETFDLGQGRSKEEVDRLGAGQVYLDYLLAIYRHLKDRGYTMQFWGDIVLLHPEMIPRLPKDLIALNWGYEANHPFEKEAAEFARAGIPFYVCPGTSSWSSVAGRSHNALGNLINAAENGLKFQAAGYLITDWGDNGHWQPLPVSYLGFAAGAAYSWALEANRLLDISEALSQHAFRDRAGVLGYVAYQLGDIYRLCDVEWSNSSVLFSILQRSFDQLGNHPKIRSIDYERVLAAVDQVEQLLEKAELDRPDKELLIQEFCLAARLLRHACRRGLLAVDWAKGGPLKDNPNAYFEMNQDMLEIEAEYVSVWSARNRPGGLVDSLARFEKSRRDYASKTAPAETLLRSIENALQ